MVRSLYSGVSGLKTHQQKMDVIGNNIANVNTYGFKGSRVTFQDVFYQTMRNATAGSAASGGTNPSQIGYGSQVGSIDTMMSRSGFASTGNALDMAIAGEGFFMVQDPSGNISYTRAGIFTIDNDGYLVDSAGNFVLGRVNPSGTTTPTNFTPYTPSDIGDLKKIQILIEDDGGKEQTVANLTSLAFTTKGEIVGIHPTHGILYFGILEVGLFDNPSGLLASGGTNFSATEASGKVKIAAPSFDGSGALVTNALEMSNVDLSQEFTDMIITQRGFQANSRIITTSDSMLEELVNLKR